MNREYFEQLRRQRFKAQRRGRIIVNTFAWVALVVGILIFLYGLGIFDFITRVS